MLPKQNPLSLQIDPNLFAQATDDEKARQVKMSESVSFFKDAMRRLRRNPIAMVSLGLIVLIILIAFGAPVVYPYDYSTQDVRSQYLGPFEYSESERARMDAGEKIFPHIMGTDQFGRDYAIRVIYGTRISLMVGILAAFIVIVTGVIYGAVSGYFGGRLDIIMMRIVDIIYALPDVLLVILLSVFIKDFIKSSESAFLLRVGSGMISIFIVFGLFYWVGMARQVRGQILSVKEQEYVLAATAIGAKASHIIMKHMVPNCVSVIIIVAAMQIPSAIFTESFLSYLGLGVSVPMPSLGSLAADAKEGLQSYPFLLMYPSAVVFLIVLSFNLLGTGLRDAFDPKMRSQGVK
jgi:oligopeptide transport system permease protein